LAAEVEIKPSSCLGNGLGQIIG